MVFNNRIYDVLKWITQFMLPGLGTLYFALAKIWKFPYGEEIVGSIAAVTAFLGLLLGISSHNYVGDGVIQVNPEGLPVETETAFDSTITLNISDFDLLNKDRVILQVERTDKKEK